MRTMHWLVLGTVVMVMALAANAGAQTKFSGSANCAKPDPNYTVTVGDSPGHAIALAKFKCTWTKGDLGGDALKEEDDTFTSDVSGKTSRDKGYGVGTTASGAKYFITFLQGTTTYEKDSPVSGTCTWKLTGGTGKLKGLTGKGTCTGKYDSTGTSVFDVEGEYQVGAAKAK